MSTASLGAPVWRGERGRTEVWYATFTDATTGTGGWVHAETVAPKDGGEPYGHGWVAVFEPDRAPVVERFGPAPVERGPDDAWFRLGDVEIGDGVLRGRTATISWDLRLVDSSEPLFTFPRVVWERHLLPGAQIVPQPCGEIGGTLSVGERTIEVGGHGALARIFGHGSAQRWGWLHAPLGEDGVLEIVTATARRPGLRRLPPLALVQLRLPGRSDWPAHPALAAPRFRTELRPDGFAVRGRASGARLEVEVSIPADRSVRLLYTDPDGATATCTNSERASARVCFDDGSGPQRWHLDGVAHAEVGTRPGDPTAD